MRYSYTYNNTGTNENLLFSENTTIAKKQNNILLYEKDNHLGNVLSVTSDRKLAHSSDATTIDYYLADIQSATDYYAFGSPMPGRTFNPTAAKYGFNGKEKDDEIKGSGNSYDFGARIYDPRIGRWLSEDRVVHAELSPYQFGSNNPIIYIDVDGNDEFYFNLKYKDSKKRTLLDGKNSYSIPEYSRRVIKLGMNEYFYKTSERTKLNESEPYVWDEKKQMPVANYETSPNYIKINSPMTIKGGDGLKPGNEGFNSLELIDEEKALRLVGDFAASVKPSATITDVDKMFRVKNNSGETGLLNFKVTLGLKEDVLYKIGDTYYNKNEAGNYYWGYAMAQMNYSEENTYKLANIGTQILSKGNRNYDEPWEIDAVLDGWNQYQKDKGSCEGANESKCEHDNVDMYSNPK